MSVMVVLIGASIGVSLIFLIAFIYSVRKGQFDDRYTPSVRILFDETKIIKENTKDFKKETQS